MQFQTAQARQHCNCASTAFLFMLASLSAYALCTLAFETHYALHSSEHWRCLSMWLVVVASPSMFIESGGAGRILQQAIWEQC